jgi:hypothetical protein
VGLIFGQTTTLKIYNSLEEAEVKSPPPPSPTLSHTFFVWPPHGPHAMLLVDDDDEN